VPDDSSTIWTYTEADDSLVATVFSVKYEVLMSGGSMISTKDIEGSTMLLAAMPPSGRSVYKPVEIHLAVPKHGEFRVALDRLTVLQTPNIESNAYCYTFPLGP
jgi:hypothetical protein